MIALIKAARRFEDRGNAAFATNASDDPDAHDCLERDRRRRAIAAAIATLPEREAQVLQLYFVEELNLEEIGEVLGVGAARICQIKKAALTKLRGQLTGWADD